MLHCLRITVTALSLTACVLLVALWVRSYWRADTLAGLISPNSVAFALEVKRGVAACFWASPVSVFSVEKWWFDNYYPDASRPTPGLLGFYAGRTDDGSLQGLMVPIWFLLLLAVTLAVVPWMRRRFSLRTMLIASTLVAVGLGIMAVSR